MLFFAVLFFVSVHCISAEASVSQIAQLNQNGHLENALWNILEPRGVGTLGHEKVKNFIKNELESMGLATEIDTFVAPTPFGNQTFSNIIGVFNPTADYFLALACHYDTKYFANIPNFVGAIDSAVPCAIMLNTMKVLLPELQNNSVNCNTGIMLLFFDGEEAFVEWTEEDSIYGSKHLAKKLQQRKSILKSTQGVVTDIDRIDVLVLLDLIGAARSKFYSFFPNTAVLHQNLVNIERKLAQNRLLQGRHYQFFPRAKLSVIDDDHRPFLQRNVPVLHLITTPFPDQWHTEKDDAAHLHWPSIHNFNMVLRVFVYEYISTHADGTSFRQLGFK